MSLVPLYLPGDGRVKPDAPSLDLGDPINRGLVSCWGFYEGGGHTLHDIAGGNHGAEAASSGGSYGLWENTERGMAYYKNPSDDRARFDVTEVSFADGVPWSVMLEMKRDEDVNQISLSNTAGEAAFKLLNDDMAGTFGGVLTFWSNYGALQPATEDWLHVAMICDGTNVDGYVMRAGYAPTTKTITPTSTAWAMSVIGGLGQYNGLQAHYTQVRLWDRVVTQSELGRLWGEPWTGIVPPRAIPIESANPTGLVYFPASPGQPGMPEVDIGDPINQDHLITYCPYTLGGDKVYPALGSIVNAPVIFNVATRLEFSTELDAIAIVNPNEPDGSSARSDYLNALPSSVTECTVFFHLYGTDNANANQCTYFKIGEKTSYNPHFMRFYDQYANPRLVVNGTVFEFLDAFNNSRFELDETRVVVRWNLAGAEVWIWSTADNAIQKESEAISMSAQDMSGDAITLMADNGHNLRTNKAKMGIWQLWDRWLTDEEANRKIDNPYSGLILPRPMPVKLSEADDNAVSMVAF